MKKTMLIIFGTVAIGLSVVFFVFNFLLYPKAYSNYVERYSVEHGIDANLVYAIIKAESGFDAKAVSSAGAVGLMQLLPATAEWIADELGEDFSQDRLLDPETNIKYGCFYLNYLLKKFSSRDAVICAYNAGEGVIRTWLDENGELPQDNIKYSETKNYLNKVTRFYNHYKSRV